VVVVALVMLASNGDMNANDECDDDDEKVVAYEMEGSICGSTTRSNVSCLTFPNEPVADITFIRSLLVSKYSYFVFALVKYEK
jgi:hypothetical protein